jgi:hydroxymethylbilane synthase
MPVRLTIGSRGSTLALWQTRFVEGRLTTLDPALSIDIVVLQTTGDRITDVPLARIGDTGLFTRELDRALLAGEVDAAVHSLKDVPTRLPEGLRLAAVLERDDPRDALLTREGMPSTLEALPAGSRVGTSSLRRRALLMHARPDLEIVDLRGNVDTRMARLADGACDAAILAAAGLRRLGREDAVRQWLEPPGWLPAPGQGALAIVTRAEDVAAARVAVLDHEATRAAVTAERSFLRALEGGCQVPIGALATLRDNALVLHGFAADDEEGEAVHGVVAAAATTTADALAAAAALGVRLADDLEGRGGAALLARVRARARTHGSMIAPGAP